MKYIEQFFKWNCKSDIMQYIKNFGSKPVKEITEAMSIRNIIVDIVLKHKMKYDIIDLCSGAGLAGIFCIFTLPVKNAICIDIKKRKKK